MPGDEPCTRIGAAAGTCIAASATEREDSLLKALLEAGGRSARGPTPRIVRSGLELPPLGSNQDSPDQSAGPRAAKTDKMTGSGVPTSIGALSV